MVMLANQSQGVKPETTVVSLTTVQRALWQLGMPILDASAVAEYKKRAKLVMLWSAIRLHVLSTAVLVALVCIGRQWGRAAIVAGAGVVLITLFGWLVSVSDLRWMATTYPAYRSLHPVPAHVSAAANALLERGVSEAQIGVEYLKSDPILFVEDVEQGSGDLEQNPSVKRYDLIVW